MYHFLTNDYKFDEESSKIILRKGAVPKSFVHKEKPEINKEKHGIKEKHKINEGKHGMKLKGLFS